MNDYRKRFQAEQAQIQEWLSNLQVGDKAVVIRHNYGNRIMRFTEVSKVTKTRIYLENGHTFTKDGREYGGDSWCRNSIEPVTPELLAEQELKVLRSKLRNVNLARVAETLDAGEIRQLLSLLKVEV